MAFDRDAFLASFLNQMSSGIAQKRQEAEKYKEKQEAAYERNQQLIATRNARASQAVSLGKQALQYLPEGANSKAMVRTALASGMTGVQEFRDKLAKAHADAGLRAGERLSVQDVEAIISMPNIPSIDQSLIDMSLEDFAKKTYGAKVEAAPVEEDDPSIIGQLFGIGAKDRVKRELRETEAFDGMSIADVNAAARMNDFNSLIPNAVMSFAEMERFDRNDAIKFSRALAAEYDEALTSRAADDAATAAMTAFLSTDAGKNAGPDEIDNVKKMARIAYAQKFVKRTIETESGIYGEMLLSNEIAAQQIKNLMGENYYNTILSDYSLSDEEEPEEIAEEVAEEAAEETVETPETAEETPEVEETTPPVIDPVEPRPGGRRGFSGKQRAWDDKYKGKFDPVTGEPIIVEPRPADGGPATGRGRNKKTAAEKWDSKYGDTHNPDGTPKAVEE
jgi:hypothetical protein